MFSSSGFWCPNSCWHSEETTNHKSKQNRPPTVSDFSFATMGLDLSIFLGVQVVTQNVSGVKYDSQVGIFSGTVQMVHKSLFRNIDLPLLEFRFHVGKYTWISIGWICGWLPRFQADVFGIAADLSGLSQVGDVLVWWDLELGVDAFFHRSTSRCPCGTLQGTGCIDVVRTRAVRCVISLECILSTKLMNWTTTCLWSYLRRTSLQCIYLYIIYIYIYVCV